MYINFINKTDYSFIVEINSEAYPIEPQGFARVFSDGEKAAFTAELKPIDLTYGLKEDFIPENLKEKVLYKFTKKFLKKLPDAQLNAVLTYELTDAKGEYITVEIEEGAYPICEGNVANFFDMVPIVYSFARCETEDGNLNIVKAHHNNRKEFLKLFEKITFYIDSGLIFADFFLFIPKYILAKILTSNFCIAKILGRLYKCSRLERTNIIFEKINRIDSEQKGKKGCLYIMLEVLLGILLLVALFVWANWDEIKLL